MADPDSSSEIVKAGVEGATKGAISALLEPISGFLGKLFGAPAEELGGWTADQIAFRRWKTQVRLIQKAEKFLDDAGIEAGEVPRNVLFPLLEAGGDDEADGMPERWAALLANAAASTGAVPPSFPRILAELSQLDALILDGVFEKVTEVDPWTDGTFDTSTSLVKPEMLSVSLDNLFRLNLIALPPGQMNAGLTGGRAHAVTLTHLGFMFVQACSPPSRSPESA